MDLDRTTLTVLATACGIAVGTVYLPQALVPLIASDLRVGAGEAATVTTATQAGYAVGIALIVPFGDRLGPGRLATGTLLAAAVALVLAAAAPGLGALAGAAACVGVLSVAGQLISVLAATCSDDRERGRVVGVLLSGSIAGMLLARLLAGTLGQAAGWRVPYLLAAALSVGCAVVLARVAPQPAVAPAGGPLGRLLSDPVRLLRREPALRRSCLYQALIFAAFTAVWSAVALLLTGPEYRQGTGAVGALAFVGAVTAGCTPAAGRLVDRRGADRVNLASMAGVLAAAAVLLAAGRGGALGVAALVIGVCLLDVGMQSGMVANVTRMLSACPAAPGRATTAYMVCAYAAGAAGSWAGAQAYAAAGWSAVCGLVALLGLAAAGTLALTAAGSAESPSRLASGP